MEEGGQSLSENHYWNNSKLFTTMPLTPSESPGTTEHMMSYPTALAGQQKVHKNTQEHPTSNQMKKQRATKRKAGSEEREEEVEQKK